MPFRLILTEAYPDKPQPSILLLGPLFIGVACYIDWNLFDKWQGKYRACFDSSLKEKITCQIVYE